MNKRRGWVILPGMTVLYALLCAFSPGFARAALNGLCLPATAALHRLTARVPFAVAELEVVGAGGILPDLEGSEVVSDEDALQEFALAVEEVSLQAVHRDLKTVEHQLCEILGGVGEHHGVEGDLRVGVDAHCLDLVGLLDTFGHGNGSVAVGGRLRDDLSDGVADTSGAALRVTAHGHNRGLPHDACT